MPWTVGSAFEQFRRDVVDLDPKNTEKARASRDYLFYQIKMLATNNSDCPKLESGSPFINFGSFARRTKIRPLDDIDFLVVFNGSNTVAENIYSSHTYKLKFIKPTIYFASTLPSMTLEQFTDSDYYVNSTRLLNRIKDYLSSVKDYEKAETLRKNLQAVTLKLSSYSWNYDIVPAILNNCAGKPYFLIPDGKGNWIATDPRIDASNTTRVNAMHDEKFLSVIRLLKYWNNITYNKPRLPSYYFETLAIKVFELSPKITDLPHAVSLFFDRCPYYLRQPCPDPKGLNPDLDAKTDSSQKEKVIEAMANALVYAGYASIYEFNSKHKDAIEQWQRIFGSEFPNYG
jgi:hypothetical protein